jgi:acyl-CoA dehydrogenase
MMTDATLNDSFIRLLEAVCSLAQVREAEARGSARLEWTALNEAGFADALVPEAYGGAGLSLHDVHPLLVSAGEHLLPLPLGETMIARHLIVSAGLEAPGDDPIILWPEHAVGDSRALWSAFPPAAAGPAYALRQHDRQASLVRIDEADGGRDGFGYLTASATFSPPLIEFRLEPGVIFRRAAALSAIAIAGGISRLLQMTVEHANGRHQFGRPLSKFQAVQQQISVLAEHSVMATVASRIGLLNADEGWRVGTAKLVTADAAAAATAIAHAVHGAIGMSREHDLQLVTRRLKRLQLSFGSRGYWAQLIGRARLQAAGASTAGFVRAKSLLEGMLDAA